MISLRLDPEIQEALDVLGVEPGTRSKIVREAILLAALQKSADQHGRSEDELMAVFADLKTAQVSLSRALSRLESGE
jgi:hypothetical protein